MQEDMYSIQWHITNKCNLRCTHCYQENYDNEPKLEDLIDIYNKIERFLEKENYYADIALTGGEPLISENLIPLLEYLSMKERVKKLMILTNGTLVDEQKVKLYKKFGVDLVQISLDGGNKKIHESVRGKNSFEQTLKGIQLFKKEGISVQVQMVIHNNNVNSIYELIQLCNLYNVDRLLITRLVLEGNAKDNFKDIILSPNKYKKLLLMLNDYSKDKINKVKILKGRCLWRLIDKTQGSVCPVGINSIAILPNGDVLPCRRMPIIIGNLKKESLYKIWYGSKVLWDIRRKSNLKGKCGNCSDNEKCGGCRAIAYATTGDYLESDPYCWK